MGQLTRSLAFAGRNGPVLLFFGVLTELVVPLAAEAARPLMGIAVFAFTLGAFLKVRGDVFIAKTRRQYAMLPAFAWVVASVPMLAVAITGTGLLLAPVALGLALCMLAPPVGSASAIAAMLNLRPALALVFTVAATVASPVYMAEAAAWVGGVKVRIDIPAMLLRLTLIVGGAGCVAALMRRYAGSFVDGNPHAMTGVAVAGLLLVGLGTTHGMQALFFNDPAHVLYVLLLAFIANAGFQLLGAALFWRRDRGEALTIGLVSGNRNVTLLWAAAAPALSLQPKIELYVAMSVFPIFMMPLITRRVIKLVYLGTATA